MRLIHPTSIIDVDANIGEDVEIGPFSIIHGGVDIGRDTCVGAYCEIGVPTSLANGSRLVIGSRSLIRSHSVFYASCSIEVGLTTGHRVIVRENTRVGKGVQLGSFSDIHGDCEIGDHTRLHSGVFVAKGSTVGSFVWLMPHVMLTNDPTPPSEVCIGCHIADYAVVSARAVVLPGVHVGTGALIAAQACVATDVPDGMLAAGVPARIIGPAHRVRLRPPSSGPAYPWTNHFQRGYPPEVIAAWKQGRTAPEPGEHIDAP